MDAEARAGHHDVEAAELLNRLPDRGLALTWAGSATSALWEIVSAPK